MRGSRPLLPLAAGFAAGIAWAPFLPLRLASAAVAPLLALSPPLAPLALFGAGLAAGGLCRAPAGPPPLAGEVALQGRVESVPDRFEDRLRFLLREESRGLLEVTSPQLPYPLALGDRVRFAAELRPPAPALNPGGRDRAARLAARGVALEAYAREPPARAATPSPLAWLEAARSGFAVAAAASLPPRQAALVRALGAGDQNAVDAETMDAFSRSGLVHLLSVGGLHLAVVAFGVQRILARLINRWDAVALRLDARRAAAAIAVPVTILYALATGAQVPMVRSAIGAGAAFLGVLLDREGDALNTVCLAALAILAAEPGALLDVSFQLSFASVVGLAVLAGPIRRALPLPAGQGRLGRLREVLLQGACASAAATLATAPLVAFHFRRLSLLAVPANFVGVPVGAALTILAALAALFAAASPAAALPLLWLCRPAAGLLLWVNDLFATPSWSAVGLASPGPAGAALVYGLGLGALRLRGLARAACAAGALAALLLPGPLRALAARHAGQLELVFLSVGQGDAAVLRLPDGAAVLVDSGGGAPGRYDPGARDVLPFLRDAGIRRLAAAFVSHPHSDHLLGLPAVAAGVPPERVFGNGRAGDEAAQAALARLPPLAALAPGDAFERAGVRFEVLWPPRGREELSDNDASLVLRISYGETVFLLPGDLEVEGEEALLAAGAALGAQVVKVPHHGSRTSSGAALVAAVRPRWAVVSLASRNRFGFPHPEALERWRAAGVEVLRTDEGAVRFLSDGRTVWRAPAANAIDAAARWRGF